MTLTIVSGGQTGADRGAMDAAIELGVSFGGWAPLGWIAEDGTIPAIYVAAMRQSTSPNYGIRTRLNVQDSDGTLIVSFGEELTGGSKYTADAARNQRKPCKHLVLPARGQSRIPPEVRSALIDWIGTNHIAVLNVAGPRESKEPGLQRAVRDALVWILDDIAADEVRDLTGTMLKLADLLPAPAMQASSSVTGVDLPSASSESADPDPDEGPCMYPDDQLPHLIASSAAIRAEIAKDAPGTDAMAMTLRSYPDLMVSRPAWGIPHYDDCATRTGGACSCPTGDL